MKKRYTLVFIILIIIVGIISLPTSGYFNLENVNAKSVIELTENENFETINELKNIYGNDEVVGILTILNTDYKAVITKSKDNSKYLSRDAYGNKNRVGNPFLDYRVDIDNSKKLLIYGHNSRYIDMPFKVLENYYDRDYFDEHKYITLNNMKFEIFSVYVETEDWSYMNIDFKDDEEWERHLEMLKNKSIYDTGVNISNKDSILILQTCSTKKEYLKYKKKFLLIVSRRVS